MESQSIKISKLKSNTGQISGLPANPRFIRDERFKKLKKSIEDLPEMYRYRCTDFKKNFRQPHRSRFELYARFRKCSQN